MGTPRIGSREGWLGETPLISPWGGHCWLGVLFHPPGRAPVVTAAPLLPSPPTHLHKERQDGHTDHAAQAVAQGQGPGLSPPLRLAARQQGTSLAESPATAAARPLLWLPGISQLPGLAQALETWRPLRLPEEGLLLPLGHLLGSQHLQAPCA